MRLSDIKGEHALDVLADIMDPLTEILSDQEVKRLVMCDDRMGTVRHVLKEHKTSLITILALLDGQDPETYEPTLPSIPVKILEILNDPMFVPLFQSQGQNPEKTSSGSVMVNTEARGK